MPTAKMNILVKARFPFKQEDETAETWERNMATLFHFHRAHGHTRVSGNCEFSKWVHRQRSKCWKYLHMCRACFGCLIHLLFFPFEVKGYHGRLPTRRYARLHALNFEFDPNYSLRPLCARDTGILLLDMDVFRSKNAAAVEDEIGIPEKDTVSHLRRVGWHLLVYGPLVGALTMYVSFSMAVGVGLHMGYLILRGDVDVPKIYDHLCIRSH